MSADSKNDTNPSLLGRLGINPNDADSWEEFVSRYGDMIYRWCQKWGLQDADAQDVTQEILLHVFHRIRVIQYDSSKSFRGWLRTIAHAAWCDWLRTQRKPGKGTGDTEALNRLAAVEARDDFLKALDEEHTRELVELASIQVQLRVDRQTWDAFRLQAWEGLSGAEVANRLSMKVGTVFVAKSRVLKMLQDTVRELEQV